jgi:hypothetical protein
MEALPQAMGIAERTAALEKALINEYLGDHAPPGHPLTREQAEQMWKDALLHAALKLEEVRARAHLLDTLHERPTCM